MAGAGDQTRRVTFVNANWSPGADGGRGVFALHVVTEDGARHSLPMHGDDAAGVIALTQSSKVMLFDPEGSTLIAGNLAGEWFQHDWAAGDERRSGTPHGR